jgi:eukaryotic-like serine/threonine-protein kinase
MIGRTISHYAILEQLGAGGMGVVYCARDEKLKRDVALKVLPPTALEDESARSRFQREALALSQLNHPNICTIYETGEADGQTYIVMEYVEGRPLSASIRAGGMAAETAIGYGTQIAAALADAHRQGLLHRDLKSSNVMVTKHGRVKLLDFGLAKRVEPESSEATRTQDTLTEHGTAVGTLAYMAPEVLRGEPADARSEIWSLGVLLHEMLAGARPFQGTSAYTLTSAILREPPAPLPEQTPAGLRGIVRKCLTKEPAQRYQSAVEVEAALQAVSPDSGVTTSARRMPFRWLLAVAAIVAIVAVWLGPRLKRWTGSPGRIESVAVLPFDNLSKDPEQEFFADGMTEQLITNLSKIRSLRVISRTSVMRYRGGRKPLPEIARELGADVVVVGSVMRSAEKVRIGAQLIQARGDQHLWAESYERDLSEVLTLQREVARTIADEIRITVTPTEQAQLAAGRRVDPEVHQLVLRGQYYANKGTEKTFKEAISYFEQALARDPNYAPAHAGLAFVYGGLSTHYLPPREAMPKAKAAAERALQLDETLHAAHISLASIQLFYEWDWPQAEKHLKRALELNPSSAEAHLLHGNYLAALGRPREALAEVRVAQALDPLSLAVQFGLIGSLMAARQFDEVIEQVHRITQREPNFAFGYMLAALAYAEKGEFDRAIEMMEKATKIETNPTFTAMTAHVQAAKGNRREAEKLLAELKALSSRRYVCAYEVAHAYVKLGDKKQAFEWLEKGKRERADCMTWLLSEPWMDPLRGDPRYRAIIEHVGLATGKAGQKP